MSIIRKRSASPKAYIPQNARENHYLLAEFPLTEKLTTIFAQHEYATPANYGDLYHKLSQLLFSLSNKLGINNCLFIANDKLARVRFSQEMHQWQTNQQILFYYNPEYHEIKKSFYHANTKAEKITLLFLASGSEIRVNSALFHRKVIQLLEAFEKELQVGSLDIRLRDHQHLTYDLFARSKGQTETKAHKIRPINLRYASQKVTIPEKNSQMIYGIVNIPVTNSLLASADIDLTSSDPYNPLYTLISDAFTLACKQYNLSNAAMIANGLVPLVRRSEHDTVSSIGELQWLGYNPEQTSNGIVCKWDATNLVDAVQLVFVADQHSLSEHGYAKFLNQIEKAVIMTASELELQPQHEEIIIRFHQHIAYDFVENQSNNEVDVTPESILSIA